MLVKTCNVIALVFIFCGVILPIYANMAIAMIALPIFIISAVAFSKGIYTLDGAYDERSFSSAFTLATIALMLYAYNNTNLLAWGYSFKSFGILNGLAVLGAALLTIIIGYVQHGLRRASLLFYIAITYFSSYGAVALTNRFADTAPTQKFETTVLDKHQLGSGYSREVNYLTLKAWGPRINNNDVSVPWMFYHSVQKGEHVCVYLHAGALGVEWYLINRCS